MKAAGGSGPANTGWDDLIYLGVITRTQGHRGDLRVKAGFDPVDSFHNLKSDEIILRPPETPNAPGLRPAFGLPPTAGLPRDCRIVHVGAARVHQGDLVLTLAEIADMTAAEPLRRWRLYTRETDLWPLPDGQFYEFELLGFELIDATTGEPRGTVTGLDDGAAHTYIKARKAGAAKDFLVPWVPAMVAGVDRGLRRVMVTLPEGLDEL